jgi:hypothetical protein
MCGYVSQIRTSEISIQMARLEIANLLNTVGQFY